MNNVIWKSFRLADTFQRNTPPSTEVPAKELNISDSPFENSIALITRAETNNGIRGYIEKGTFPTIENAITYNDQFSLFLYHKYEFTTIKDHLSIITATNETLQSIMLKNDFVNIFIVTILNHVFSKDIFNFNFTGADYRFDREIILLPCLEVSDGQAFIWEEDGKHYTLAVEYIKKLMDEAKELREQKTIRLYEAERQKYEAERQKYEAEYKKQKNSVIWKSFRLGDLFEWSKRKDLSLKSYNLIDHYEDGYVEVVTGSMNSNNNYVLKTELPKNYPVYSNCLCINTNGSIGYCFYYAQDIVSPTSSVHVLIHRNEQLKDVMNPIVNQFFARMMTSIFATPNFNRTSCLIDNDKFDREIILLPCLEVSDGQAFIWEEDGKHYTLAIEYIAYLYLTGKMNYNQKLVDNYTYQY